MSAATPCISVLIPVFNESATIHEILRRVASNPLVREIIVVDDCSTDGTREKLLAIHAEPAAILMRTDLRWVLLLHPRNRGKGAALRTAIPHATSEISLVQDADLEYDPADYGVLAKPILDGDADVVFGSRFIGSPRRTLLFLNTIANKILTFASNLATGLNLTDMETCLKAFKTELLQALPLRCNGFEFEPEVTAKVSRLGARVYEVPVSYRARDYHEGKKIRWWHAFTAVFTILRFWISSDAFARDSGHFTLRIMERTGRYNRWIFESIRPWLGSSVLEVGSGVGNITQFLFESRSVTASDINPLYLRELKRLFGRRSGFNVRALDITRAPEQDEPHYDSIVCLNVLEHVEDDGQALRNLYQRLRPGGRLILYVPATPRIFGPIDVHLGHFRRYSKRGLVGPCERAGFRIVHQRYHHIIGALGWLINGRLLRRTHIPVGQAKHFDRLMPLLQLERWVESEFSMSLLCIAERPAGGAVPPAALATAERKARVTSA